MTELPNTELPNTELLVEITRSWLGTPYHNNASVKNVGCDCLGLLRGVYSEVTGQLIETPVYPAHPPRAGGPESLLQAARKYLVEVPSETRDPGIVLVFRVHKRVAAWHCGIMTSKDTMVHAHSGAQAYEVALGNRWNRRVAAAFKFKE